MTTPSDPFVRTKLSNSIRRRFENITLVSAMKSHNDILNAQAKVNQLLPITILGVATLLSVRCMHIYAEYRRNYNTGLLEIVFAPMTFIFICAAAVIAYPYAFVLTNLNIKKLNSRVDAMFLTMRELQLDPTIIPVKPNGQVRLDQNNSLKLEKESLYQEVLDSNASLVVCILTLFLLIVNAWEYFSSPENLHTD